MKLEMFGIYDIKALCYGTPMYATTTAVAKRLFADLVNAPGSTCNRHPDDFHLHHLGDFDDNSGITCTLEHSVPLGAARIYLQDLEYVECPDQPGTFHKADKQLELAQ